MIERYSLKKMSELFAPKKRFHFMLEVEKAVAKFQGEEGLIPKDSAKAIFEKSKFSYESILKREEKHRHDVTAFVEEVASHLSSHGAYVHYGLTSSDVLDTALSLQIKEASQIIEEDLKALKKTLKALAIKYKSTLCAGRTHGMHAEPTTFGFKMLGFLAEIERASQTFKEASEKNQVGKLSGAVGVYSALSPSLEAKVCKFLKLEPEDIATQVIPRDRLARLLFSLSLAWFFHRKTGCGA